MRFEEIVNANFQRLNENDRYILRIISSDKKACSRLSINELAARCNVSRTTIMRFAQKLGFDGFSTFRAFLSFEMQLAAPPEQNLVDSLYDDVKLLKEQLSEARLLPVCRLLYKAERVFIYGTGAAQKEVAKEMQRIFMVVRKYMHVIEGEAEMENLMDDLTQNDLLLLISFSGENKLFKNLSSSMAMRGVPYVSLTSLRENFLAQNTPYSLYVPITPLVMPSGQHYNTTVLFFMAADVLMRRFAAYIAEQP